MKLAARPQLRRLAFLDQQIREGKFPNAAGVARDLEVAARTVQRDIEFLRDSWHAPLEFDSKRNGYFYTQPDYALPTMRLTEGELIGLFLGERLLQQYRGQPFADQLAAVFEKLTSALPDEVSLDLAHLREAYSIRTEPANPAEAKMFAQLSDAVGNRKRIEIEYWTAKTNEVNHRRVDPYHLSSILGEWYLIGYCHLRKEIRMFAPGRIRSLQTTQETFPAPDGFEASKYLDVGFRAVRGTGPPRTVRLRFEASIAPWIREKVWHPSQQSRELDNGRLELAFQLSDFLEVRRWAMSWGSECEVLEPEELREEVRAEVRRMSSAFG